MAVLFPPWGQKLTSEGMTFFEQERTSRKGCLERAKGIEPSYEAWEASVLPLNYARAGAVRCHHNRRRAAGEVPERFAEKAVPPATKTRARAKTAPELGPLAAGCFPNGNT